jgi:hypothetical protein
MMNWFEIALLSVLSIIAFYYMFWGIMYAVFVAKINMISKSGEKQYKREIEMINDYPPYGTRPVRTK